MARVVKIKHPYYGEMELNVDRVIAVAPEKHAILFEEVSWFLKPEEFNEVYKVWNEMK